jgi:hypothetical protein
VSESVKIILPTDGSIHVERPLDLCSRTAARLKRITVKP